MQTQGARDNGSTLVSMKREAGWSYKFSCTATIDAPIAQVREACESWARDLRWHKSKETERSIVFHLYRHELLLWHPLFSPNVGVELNAADDRTEGTFWVDLRGEYGLYGWHKSCSRLCETFARGVCSDLASRGATVVPADLETPLRDRRRLAAIATGWLRIRAVLWALCVLLAVAYVVTLAVLRGNGYPPISAFAGALFGLTQLSDAIRERSFGRSALFALVVSCLLVAAFVPITVVSFYIYP